MLTRLRSRRAGEAGIVAVNLVVVLAFALYAVIQLSRTTLAAKQIKDRVKVIRGEVVPINSELNNVPKLDETNRIAADILTAAKPLTGQLDQVIAAAASIDRTVSAIQTNANEINATVKGINANANTLTPTVTDINQGVKAINGRVDRILAPVGGIKADTGTIRGQVDSINAHANSIDCTVIVSGRFCNRG